LLGTREDRQIGGSRKGASLSEEAHCGGLRGRAPLLGNLVYKRKALGRASVSIGAHLRPRETGNQEEGFIYRGL
jgi:hypothetical protein